MFSDFIMDKSLGIDVFTGHPLIPSSLDRRVNPSLLASLAILAQYSLYICLISTFILLLSEAPVSLLKYLLRRLTRAQTDGSPNFALGTNTNRGLSIFCCTRHSACVDERQCPAPGSASLRELWGNACNVSGDMQQDREHHDQGAIPNYQYAYFLRWGHRLFPS